MFHKVIERFEQHISQYAFSVYCLDDEEYVYDVENSIILHISKRKENYGRVVIEEIFNDGLLSLGLKQLEQPQEGYLIQYFPYNGGLGNSNPFMRSRFERVNNLVPQLKIEERFNNWPGFSIPFLLFELTEEEQVGYALYHTRAKQTIKKVISAGEDLLFACLNAKTLSSYNDSTAHIFSSVGIKYSFTLDRTIIDILTNRWSGKTQSWRKTPTPLGYWGVEAFGMKFCWINARVKYSHEIFDGKIINDIKAGLYDDVDRYEFILPENKWKSEQLVYQITSQLYPKGRVWYQYRPLFLNTGRGQLSYDVYIEKLRIAIEYQGKQHFEPIEIFGGEEGFKRQTQRDLLKAQLSRDNGVKLIYINYWEDISPDLIQRKIKEALS